jgi:very-short-patch-repair endonuclease
LTLDNAASHDYYRYNKDLRPLAGALRKNMTKAEACLWKYVLRAGMMKGHTINRQRPVMNYIADFFCKRLCLVIEVDGITHQQEEVRRKDKKKEEDLVRAGFRVVRFTDDEVLSDIEGVRRTLELCIEGREKELGSTSP